MRIVVGEAVFNPEDWLAQFARGRTDVGAIVSFTGLARADQGEATRLDLEAYPGFTEARIGEIAVEAAARFGLLDLLIVHRTGEIAPGEAIVLVAAAAPHRREAFEAADYLMDYLKSRAPFWKKETGPEGSRWIEPSARDLGDVERWES